MPADKLFYRMKSTREYFAVVVDEYGGMSGIVTIHDLIELLVGDLTDKGEVSEYEILPLSDREWKMTGRTPLDEVEKALKIKFPEEAKEENETLGGYACSLLGGNHHRPVQNLRHVRQGSLHRRNGRYYAAGRDKGLTFSLQTGEKSPRIPSPLSRRKQKNPIQTGGWDFVITPANGQRGCLATGDGR